MTQLGQKASSQTAPKELKQHLWGIQRWWRYKMQRNDQQDQNRGRMMMMRQRLTNWLVCHLSVTTDIIPPVIIAQRLGANSALMVMGRRRRNTRWTINSGCQNPQINYWVGIFGSVLRSRQLTLHYTILLVQSRAITLSL